MKIKETIERDCCDPDKDLKRVDVPNFQNCGFCIHCGQWWLDPEKEDPTGFTLPDREFKRLYPALDSDLIRRI